MTEERSAATEPRLVTPAFVALAATTSYGTTVLVSAALAAVAAVLLVARRESLERPLPAPSA
jgi:hypothetical protein